MGRFVVGPSGFGYQIHIAEGTKCDENVAIACWSIARCRRTQYHFYHTTDTQTHGLCGRERAQHRETSQNWAQEGIVPLLSTANIDTVRESIENQRCLRQFHKRRRIQMRLLSRRQRFAVNGIERCVQVSRKYHFVGEFNFEFRFMFWILRRELHIEGDPTSIYLSASALVSLQKLYGRIPKIYGKGNHAQKVCELMKSMGKDELTAAGSSKGAIDQLIILDRSIDLMSVLATQLTYEGLIGRQFKHSPTELLIFHLLFSLFQMKFTA